MDTQKYLEQFGFTTYEARVYGALLEASPQSATMLAKRCGLSRSTIYTVLSVLSQKSLVGTTYKNNIKQFAAAGISVLEERIKQEQSRISEKVSALEPFKKMVSHMQHSSLQVPGMVFFEGQEGLKKIYITMMRNAPRGAVRYLMRDEFVWSPAWDFYFKEEWKGMVARLKKEKNLKTKLLVNSSNLEKKKRSLYKKEKDLSVRYLPPSATLKSFGLYCIGDSVAILSVEDKNVVGVLLTNKHIAANFVALFEGLWSASLG